MTWRLHGSLPKQVVDRLSLQQGPSSGKYFLDIDRVLDRAGTGVAWLNDPRIAARVMAAIRRGEEALGHYVLQAFAIMPNHVHLLVHPCVSIQRITKGLKGTTAREANLILDRTGQPFWQDESFDHWVRNGKQFDRIRMYIENNPVTAGLVRQPQLWPWSSASQP